MIKFSLRHNLIFPLQLIFWTTLREIESSLINHFFHFGNLIIYTPLMFLGEILAGLIFFLYQQKFESKKKAENTVSFMQIEFIETTHDLVKDSDIKIIFLIFTSSFSDFVQFLLLLELPKFINISTTLELRFRGVYTIYNALFYYFYLRLPILRHQLFSLVIIVICILIIVISEFIIQPINIFLSYGQFILALFFIFCIQYISALEISIEKYLFEYNQMSPFLVLLLEGIFGFVLCVIYCLFQDPFIELTEFKSKNSILNFTILILALVLYVIFSGGKNLFRVVTTKIYNPMTTTFMGYILNPFYIIFYFARGTDFTTNGKRNWAYFIINLIMSIILTFIGMVFNEFLILFCCKLNYHTHGQIAMRANKENELAIIRQESISSELEDE